MLPWQSRTFASSALPSTATGVATTTRAQVKGYRKAPTFVRRHLIPTNVPMSLIEVGWEAVRPRGLCREHLEERGFDLFIGIWRYEQGIHLVNNLQRDIR